MEAVNDGAMGELHGIYLGLFQAPWSHRSGPSTTTAAGCTAAPAGATTYAYAGDGLRTQATVRTGTTVTSSLRFSWDVVAGGGTPLLTSDGQAAYIYGATGTAPIEEIKTGVATFLSSSSSGVQAVFSSSGALLEEAAYTAYGTQVLEGGTKVTPFGFQGAYTDASGLLYMVNRYYTPKAASFLSVDPMLAQTQQPYAFTGGDPLNMADPLGLVRGKYYWNHTKWNIYLGTTYTWLCVGNQIHCGGPKCGNGPCYPSPGNVGNGSSVGSATSESVTTAQTSSAPSINVQPPVHLGPSMQPQTPSTERSNAVQAYMQAPIVTPSTTLLHDGVNFVKQAAGAVGHFIVEHESCIVQGAAGAGGLLLSGGGDAIVYVTQYALSYGMSQTLAGAGGFLVGCISPPTPPET